jgi:hypothetical protein
MKLKNSVIALSLLMIVAAGCVDRVELDGRPCPCMDGYTCVADRCVVSTGAGLESSATEPWKISGIGLNPATGWRQSGALFSHPAVSHILTTQIQSHPDYLAVLVVGEKLETTHWRPERDATPLDTYAQAILIHDGSGWSSHALPRPRVDDGPFVVVPPGPARGPYDGFGATPRGELFLSSREVLVGPVVLEDLARETALPSRNLSALTGLAIVDDELSYAVAADKVLRFDGNGWGPVPAALPHRIHGIWANHRAIFGIGQAGTIVSLAAGSDTWRIHDTGTIDDFLEVWAFDENDVFATTVTDLYHYDGQRWSHAGSTEKQLEGSASNKIEHMWGHDDTLYLSTDTHLLRFRGGTLETVAGWPCTTRPPTDEEVAQHLRDLDPDGLRGAEQTAEAERQFRAKGICSGGLLIRDIWGNAADELFLLVSADQTDDASPARLALLRYDGATFSQI